MISETNTLSDLSPYIYGTTRLGDSTIAESDRIEIARKAINSGVWFHTSRQYGDALEVQRKALVDCCTTIPRYIAKIGGETMEELRASVDENIKPLGLRRLDIGQLCLGGALVDDFASEGKCYKELEALKKEGLVGRFVYEVFPWTSEAPLRALKKGVPEGLIDAFIFYLNPLQRFASNELWDLLQEKGEQLIAMRTVSGGDIYRLRDVPGAAWKDYLRQRAIEVAPVFEASGVRDWAEFCIRFAHSVPGVVATVGSTSRVEGLEAFLEGVKDLEPLSVETMESIFALQRRWSEEVDVKAEPWSM